MVFAEPVGDYSWLFDLVAADHVVRRQALARHQALLAAARGALRRWNALWAVADPATRTQPQLVAALDQVHAERRWHEEQTLRAPVDAFLRSAPDDGVAQALWAPFAVLYLRWEADYPDEWRAPGSWGWSPWTTKAVLLRRLDRRGLPEEIRPQIAELVLSALERPYRCKDWMYACLVRHLDEPLFLNRVEMLVSADDPLVRLRAQFVLDAAEHCEQRVTRTSWRRWLSADT
ncbi:hypothetical protein V6U81_23210 [Micromonospora sp. CPCC 205711]|uniref:hypothetical protein n=1 Tax=Micromonospora sp. CPCC 205547 TaxID=3122400 RepID=UPI002FF03A78